MASQNRSFKLTIKDVRCFAGEQDFDIRPLTFLIGANSTGKTTVMSCFSAIYNFISHYNFISQTQIKIGLPGPSLNSIDFNEDPYSMGSFVDIVRKSKTQRETEKETEKKTVRGKANPQSFELAISHNNNTKYHFWFTEKEAGAEPVVKQARINFKDISFCCEKKGKKLLFTIKDNKNNKIIKEEGDFPLYDNIIPLIIIDNFVSVRRRVKQDTFSEKLNHLHSWARELFADSIFSLAPIRSKPQRTYNPIRESLSPEGSEIPVFLSNLKANTKNWKSIHKNLIDFGTASGLFSNIEVKNFGKTKGDPFQLQFNIRGIESNIVDTGYGLSQILPLLVRLFSTNLSVRGESLKKGTRFLLQQPEVHLHPEAQAELASLFVKSVKLNNSFLIETHSDYILDRTRIEVRRGNIAPDQVSIIYLDPVEEGVKAYNISIDKQGNLIGAPPGYRKFFIKETHRLLGFKD